MASKQIEVGDDLRDNEKLCQQLVDEFIQDIEAYDADKYRSELMAIREKNKGSLTSKAGKAKVDFEYQSKKRLKTMSLLKNKVPQVKIEDKYLTKDEIYNQAKNLFKKRIDEEKRLQYEKRLASLKDAQQIDDPQTSSVKLSMKKMKESN